MDFHSKEAILSQKDRDRCLVVVLMVSTAVYQNVSWVKL